MQRGHVAMMHIRNFTFAEDRQNLPRDHRPIGFSGRRRLARQMFGRIPLGEVLNRRGLAGFAPFARRVLALVDPPAKSFSLDARGKSAPSGELADPQPTFDSGASIVYEEGSGALRISGCRRENPQAETIDFGIPNRNRALGGRRHSLD